MANLGGSQTQYVLLRQSKLSKIIAAIFFIG